MINSVNPGEMRHLILIYTVCKSIFLMKTYMVLCISWNHALILITPPYCTNHNYSRWRFFFFFFFVFNRVNKIWHLMWIICKADNSWKIKSYLLWKLRRKRRRKKKQQEYDICCKFAWCLSVKYIPCFIFCRSLFFLYFFFLIKKMHYITC